MVGHRGDRRTGRERRGPGLSQSRDRPILEQLNGVFLLLRQHGLHREAELNPDTEAVLQASGAAQVQHRHWTRERPSAPSHGRLRK